MPMDSCPEMADMMKWGGENHGGNRTSGNQLNPEMTAMAKMMRGDGGISTNANQPTPEMMAKAKMMMGSGGNISASTTQLTPQRMAMAEMRMTSNGDVGGGNFTSNNFGMMPRPPFNGN